MKLDFMQLEKIAIDMQIKGYTVIEVTNKLLNICDDFRLCFKVIQLIF